MAPRATTPAFSEGIETMWKNFPLFPEKASTLAGDVDALYFTFLGISTFFGLLVAGLMLYFAIRYRRRSPAEVGRPEKAGLWLEITWSVIPLVILLGMFAWGAKVFIEAFRPPSDAVEYFVTAKQWMWKFQHPQGNREINDLHVPLGQPIRLTMTSEDVIHSFFVPAFRVKSDVLPGRYTTVWFEANKTGTFHMPTTRCGWRDASPDPPSSSLERSCFSSRHATPATGRIRQHWPRDFTVRSAKRSSSKMAAFRSSTRTTFESPSSIRAPSW
jgi:heme/copper-type cytochrome/quinol oxidase subunit 2